MIKIDIPGFGLIGVEHLVSDFTGTLSDDGYLCKGVKERLNKLSNDLKIHILTADTFERAKEELFGVKCVIHILDGVNHDIQKEEYVKSLGSESVVALGNGNNDRLMLKRARVSIAVCLREGCASDAVKAADIIVTSAINALELLLNPKRIKATLRF